MNINNGGKGLKMSNKTKFLLFSSISLTASYFGLKNLRESNPKTYQKLVWNPIMTKIYPVLLTLTVISISCLSFKNSNFMLYLFLQAATHSLTPKPENQLDQSIDV